MTTNSKVGRISALDFTKGALVLIMVLYHWMNYFYGPHDTRYLRFLTPSFIFITGFIISHVYCAKYGISDPKLPKRLLQRGFKILGVFALLNVTRTLLMRESFMGRGLSSPWSRNNLIGAYLTGNAAGGGLTKVVAFSVLVPIGYLLLLSAVLVVLCRFYRYTFQVVCLLCLLCAGVLDFMGYHTYLELLAIGLIGVIAGYAPTVKVDALVRHPYMLTLAYVAYLVAITIWDVIYPLQILGVFLSLMIIYLLGLKSGEPGKVRACVLLLGKYSLVGYISQIAILQLLRLTLGSIGSATAILGLSFVLAFALTIMSVELLDRTRAHSSAIDQVYKAVFA